jgi:hypothetical protein
MVSTEEEREEEEEERGSLKGAGTIYTLLRSFLTNDKVLTINIVQLQRVRTLCDQEMLLQMINEIKCDYVYKSHF